MANKKVNLWTYNRRHNQQQVQVSVEVGENLPDKELKKIKKQLKEAFLAQAKELAEDLNKKIDWVGYISIGGMSYGNGTLSFDVTPQQIVVHAKDPAAKMITEAFEKIAP